jgi:hypothetical protein
VYRCQDAIATLRRPCLRGRLEHGERRHVVLGYLSSFGLLGMKGKIEIDGIDQRATVR